jgi:hypothetical protein
VAIGGVHKSERLVTRVEMAGWKLEYSEPHPSGDRVMLTFRRVGP